MDVPFVVQCPHCFAEVLIEQVNCRIFRHGAYKSNGEPIPPHSTKAECDALISSDLIYGCAGPFLLDLSGNAVKCDYI